MIVVMNGRRILLKLLVLLLMVRKFSNIDVNNRVNVLGTCQSSATQYYEKVVLGIDKAFLSPTAEWTDDETKITNETYALTELGNIGDIKWDITLCLLLSWIIVFACLVKGRTLLIKIT